jgi:iron complex outermembrane receptor protein
VYRNRGDKDDASAFAKASYERGSLTLFGDVQARTARFRYEPDDNAGIPSSSIHWTFVNPKVGASYRWRPNMAFYASLGQTGREPTRNDMFAGFDNVDTTNAAFVGGLDRVHPERVRDIEAGVTVLRPGLTLNANVYSMDFRNEITPIGALSYIGLPLRKNVESSYRRGVELDLVYRGFQRVTVGGNATVSWNRIREYTDDAAGLTYRDVEPLLTPRFISNQRLEVVLSRQVSLLADGRYLSRSYLANTEDTRFVTPAAYAADVALDWRIGNVSLLAQARNVGDARVFTGGYTDGQSSSYYVLAGRNLIVTARIGF